MYLTQLLADNTYVRAFQSLYGFRACILILEFMEKRNSLLLSVSNMEYAFLSLFINKTHSNSMKDKYFSINRLTDLTFDSASAFESQVSYLITSYSLASNLSLAVPESYLSWWWSMECLPHISLLCVPRGHLQWRKALVVASTPFWAVIALVIKGVFSSWRISW